MFAHQYRRLLTRAIEMPPLCLHASTLRPAICGNVAATAADRRSLGEASARRMRRSAVRGHAAGSPGRRHAAVGEAIYADTQLSILTLADADAEVVMKRRPSSLLMFSREIAGDARLQAARCASA